MGQEKHLLRRTATGTVLLAFALFGAGLLSSKAPPAHATGSCDAGDTTIDAEERAIIDLTNNYRVQHGMATLTVAPALQRAATWTANDLTHNPVFGHVDTLGREFFVRVKDCGFTWPGGENLAAGTNDSAGSTAFQKFRSSAVHNEIMLSPEFKTIGAARAQGGPYGWYWVVEFGYADVAPAAPTPVPTQAPARVVAPAPPAPVAAAAPPPPPTPPADDTPARVPENWDGSTPLAPGAHLVSWTGGEQPVDAVLEAVPGSMVVAYAYNLWFGGWLHYSPEMPAYFQTFATFSPGAQYWVLIVE